MPSTPYCRAIVCPASIATASFQPRVSRKRFTCSAGSLWFTPINFTWSAGNESSFQVQFSASENPFVPAVTSSKKFKGETSYKPKGSQWKKIRKLAANGASVYWRVVAPAGVGDPLPSLQVFQFTIEQ